MSRLSDAQVRRRIKLALRMLLGEMPGMWLATGGALIAAWGVLSDTLLDWLLGPAGSVPVWLTTTNTVLTVAGLVLAAAGLAYYAAARHAYEVFMSMPTEHRLAVVEGEWTDATAAIERLEALRRKEGDRS